MKKSENKRNTTLMPLDKVSTIAVFLEVNETDFEYFRRVLKNKLNALDDKQIKYYFIDRRLLFFGKGNITPAETTFFTGLTPFMFFYKISRIKKILKKSRADMFLSFCSDHDIFSEYFIKNFDAKFKVGINNSKIYDFFLSNVKEKVMAIDQMLDFLSKIR